MIFGFCVQIRDFVEEFQNELLKPGFNFFGLSDCKAPKVLGDIVESIAGAIFLDSGQEISVVWKVSFSKETKFSIVHSSFLSFHFGI